MVEQQKNDRHRAIKIIREVNNQAEIFYEEAVKLGDHASIAFQRNHRSQMTNLETLAESALKTTDIFDYIKRQTARYPSWRYVYENVPFSERLRNYLEKNLKDTLTTVCNNLKIGNRFRRREAAAAAYLSPINSAIHSPDGD